MKMKGLTGLLVGSLLALTPAAAAQTSLDTIVAVVDESVITRRELDDRVKLIAVDLRRAQRNLPPEDVLERQVLEALINDSLLLQEANRRGIQISDSQLNQAMQRLARQNDMTLTEFRGALIADGIDYDKYRNAVSREMTISTLRRQYSQRNASISDAEVDEFISQSGNEDASYEYRLSHILIALPDAATPEQVDAARSSAADIISRLDRGEEFDQLANTYSAGDTALQGGDLGWRKKAEIPSLFTTQVLSMSPGGHAGPIRSASGFHIVHLRERRDLQQVLIKQTRSRHILIRPNELISEEDAQKRLQEFRQRILSGEDFARLARLYSVDYTSGSEGGDIGWMEPGATVREYEAVADTLEEGELSEPFRSQFGWHLVEVTGRRTVDETAQNKRQKIFSQLLQQKQREVFDLWKRRLRDEAYVIFPEKPDA
jgi:peptidyl-prolyl cis-trans isomerase SurA